MMNDIGYSGRMDTAQAGVRLAIYGHSHINCLVEALEGRRMEPDVTWRSLQLRQRERRLKRDGIDRMEERREATLSDLSRMIWRLSGRGGPARPNLVPVVAKQGVLTVLSIRGIQHVFRGLPASERPYDFVLPEEPDLPLNPDAQLVPAEMVADYYRRVFAGTFEHISQVQARVRHNVYHLEMPPPYGDADYIRSKIMGYSIGTQMEGLEIAPALLRYKLWRIAARLYHEHCDSIGVTWVPCPPEVLQDGKYLHPDAWHEDAVHANSWFGERMLQALIKTHAFKDEAEEASEIVQERPPRARTPYNDQPEGAFWRRSVAGPKPAQVDPVQGWTLQLARETRVATAGSCFAQHIANRLARSGFNYFVTETAPEDAAAPDIAREFGYGLFSARYGNIYTSRQLVQLFDRAYGRFQPQEDVWTTTEGRLIDPFRPNIPKGGFASRQEFDIARETHFAAVRRMFEELDIFVFTLGLTEAWEHGGDGAVFPLCPGVSGGSFDPDVHRLHNLSAAEVTQDMRDFLARLREVNPASKVILTVSPVPLIATASDSHVLAATTYSKSVLRVAAEELRLSEQEAHYFPSYEVITGAHARGAYLGDDLRDVEEVGVNHVMRLFFRHAAPDAVPPRGAHTPGPAPKKSAPRPSLRRAVGKTLNVICDENSIENAVD